VTGPDPLGRVFAGLADPTRRRILELLAGDEWATASTLAASLPVSRQAVLKHLEVLDRAGLVAHTRSGKEVRYSLRPQAVGEAGQRMVTLAATWDGRLEGIRRLAERSTEEPQTTGPDPDGVP